MFLFSRFTVCVSVIFAVWVAVGTSVSWQHTKYPKGLSDTDVCACVVVCVHTRLQRLENCPVIKENTDKEKHKLRINKGKKHRGGKIKKNYSRNGRKRHKSSWRRGGV